jgi:demethylmenaquinone methyltransferase/2-methoxy-6-polyprenyl-1,4-benzoquinol methylase
MNDNNSPDGKAGFGFRRVETGERQGLVNEVFARVAGRYDLMNDLMSGGLHRLWKNDLINWLAPSKTAPGRLLDVAGGTGDIARRFLDAAGPQSTATTSLQSTTWQRPTMCIPWTMLATAITTMKWQESGEWT